LVRPQEIESEPRVWTTRDVTRANEIANHPEVLPGLSLGIADSLDLAPLLADPRNILLMGDHGFALLLWSAPGVYDVHDAVLPEGRGKWAIAAGKLVLDYAFDAYGARMLWTSTPVENRASRMFNRILGFKSAGIHEVPVPGHPSRPMEYFTMERR
jgi:hypothetical protein